MNICPDSLGELTALPSPLAGLRGKGSRGSAEKTGGIEGRRLRRNGRYLPFSDFLAIRP